MSLSASLSSALSGLSAAQRALSTTANNVANANTDGYSRKLVNQSAELANGQPMGVRPLEPTRVVDQFLTTELRRQGNTLGRDSVIAEAFGRIERGVLGAPGEQDRGLSTHLGKLMGQLEQLANTPESRPLRTAVLGNVEDLLRQVQADMTTVQNLRTDADQRIVQTVQAINVNVQEVHDLNQEISRTGGTADLEDQRDLVIKRLAEKIDISTFQNDNGRVALYTSGGHSLLEQLPRVVHYEPASSSSPSSGFNAISIFSQSDVDPATKAPLAGRVGATLVSGGYRTTVTPEQIALGNTAEVVSPLTGGRLQGHLEVRDRILPELADQLAEVGEMLAFTLNRAHNNAMPHPLPTQAIGTRTDFTAYPTGRSGTASLVVFAADGTVAADVTIDLAAAGNAAAVAAQIDAGLGATGTAQLDPATGALAINLGNGPGGEPYRMAWSEGDSRLTVEDAADRDRDYGFAHYFGLNDLVVPIGSAAGAYTVRSDIAADNRLLANVVLTRDAGVPSVGGVGDKRGVQLLAGALDAEVTTTDRGGLPGSSTTVSRYISDMTGLVAAQSGQAQNREAAGRALVEDLEFRQGAVSGVNLDEELAKLVLYQQAYSVSARLISITNDLFGELVNIVR